MSGEVEEQWEKLDLNQRHRACRRHGWAIWGLGSLGVRRKDMPQAPGMEAQKLLLSPLHSLVRTRPCECVVEWNVETVYHVCTHVR